MVSIIGAGPVGNYLAYLLGKQGHDVNVYEEHNIIGWPVQCTGITTFFLNNIMKVDDEFLVNTINRTRVYSPNNDFVEIKLKKNFIVDRTKFDGYLGKMAESNGVKYHIKHQFTGFEKLKNKYNLNFANGHKVNDDVIVGADGPRSVVAKSAGIYGKRNFMVGMQARAHCKCEEDLVEFYLGEGYFGWLVPENKKIARIGIASYDNVKKYYDSLMKRRNAKFIEYQSGIIPIYNPKLRTQKDDVYLVGDAATQVKATTLGGIIPGMMAAEELNKSIKSGKSYEKLWKKRVGRELLTHLLLRKFLDKFRDKDYDYLIELCKQQKVNRLIGENDREFPTKLVMKVLMKEPRFLSFLKVMTR